MPKFISYHEARSALTPAEQAEVDLRLAALPSSSSWPNRMQSLVTSTESELRIRPAVWRSFFKTVLGSIPATIASDLQQWGRNHALQGKPATFNHPLVTVKSRSAFELALQQQVTKKGKPISPRAARDLTDDLASKARWRVGCTRARDLGLKLGLYPIWATFSNPPLPYAGLPGKANAIACTLGLDDVNGNGITFKGNRPLVVFEYMTPGIDARIPTVAEGWSSDQPNYYFRPAQFGADAEKHGMTMPWPTASPGTLGRPEVIHAPTSLGDLTRRAKIVRK